MMIKVLAVTKTINFSQGTEFSDTGRSHGCCSITAEMAHHLQSLVIEIGWLYLDDEDIWESTKCVHRRIHSKSSKYDELLVLEKSKNRNCEWEEKTLQFLGMIIHLSLNSASWKLVISAIEWHLNELKSILEISEVAIESYYV